MLNYMIGGSPTDNKMQNIWNSHISEPKEKTVSSIFIQVI